MSGQKMINFDDFRTQKLIMTISGQKMINFDDFWDKK